MIERVLHVYVNRISSDPTTNTNISSHVNPMDRMHLPWFRH